MISYISELPVFYENTLISAEALMLLIFSNFLSEMFSGAFIFSIPEVLKIISNIWIISSLNSAKIASKTEHFSVSFIPFSKLRLGCSLDVLNFLTIFSVNVLIK